jgi:hypothetical protein
MENNGYLEYNPENIMKIFNQVYLTTKLVIPIGFDCGMANLLKKFKMRTLFMQGIKINCQKNIAL